MPFVIVFQGAEASGGVSQLVEAAGLLSASHSVGTPPPVPCLNHAVLSAQRHNTARAVGSSLFSSPDSLERCVVLSDLSNSATPAANNVCTPPWLTNNATPLSMISSCNSATGDDVQETPSSVRSGRKRKHRKRRLPRPALGCSSPLDFSETEPCRTASRSESCADDVTVKMEPRMPKLLPEPRVQYNPETPLRISIHLPLNGVINAADERLVSESVNGSAAVHSSSENHEMYPVSCCSPAVPVDLTSRASVQVPLPGSSLSAAEVKHDSCVGSVSSSVPSVGPVYSPISNMSDAENEGIGGPVHEMPRPPVFASFLDQFSRFYGESLQFSPSQSFWTSSFTDQLAKVNENGFVAVQNLPAPVLSPVSATGRPVTEVNCQRNVDKPFRSANHSGVVPVSVSVANSAGHNGHNTETLNYMEMRPMVVVDTGHNIDLANAGLHTQRDANTQTSKPKLSKVAPRSSTEAVSLNGIGSSETDILPGMSQLWHLNFCGSKQCFDTVGLTVSKAASL